MYDGDGEKYSEGIPQRLITTANSKKFRNIDILSSQNLCEQLQISLIDQLSLHPLSNNYFLTEEFIKETSSQNTPVTEVIGRSDDEDDDGDEDDGERKGRPEGKSRPEGKQGGAPTRRRRGQRGQRGVSGKTSDSTRTDKNDTVSILDTLYTYRVNLGLLRFPASKGSSWLSSKNALASHIKNERTVTGDVCFIPKYHSELQDTYCTSATSDLEVYLQKNTYKHTNDQEITSEVPYIKNMLGGKKKRRKTRTNRKKSLRHNKPKLTIIKRRFKSKKRKGKKRNKTRKRKN